MDTPDAEHMTSLHLAVQRGLAEIITLLLEGGARVNNKMNDKVLLFYSAFVSSHLAVFIAVIAIQGSSQNMVERDQKNPCMLKMHFSNNRTSWILLNQDQNPLDFPDPQYPTPHIPTSTRYTSTLYRTF